MKKMNRMLAFITAMLVLLTSVPVEGVTVCAQETTASTEITEDTKSTTESLSTDDKLVETEPGSEEETKNETENSGDTTKDEIVEEPAADETVEENQEDDVSLEQEAENQLLNEEEEEEELLGEAPITPIFNKIELVGNGEEIGDCVIFTQGCYQAIHNLAFKVTKSDGQTIVADTTEKLKNAIGDTSLTAQEMCDSVEYSIVYKDTENYLPVQSGSVTKNSDSLTADIFAWEGFDSDKEYFIKVEINAPLNQYFEAEAQSALIPMRVVRPTIYCDTKQEAYAAVRNAIRERTNEADKYGFKNPNNYDSPYIFTRIAVKSGVFSQQQISLVDALDLEAERAGMLPDEGDYLFHVLGNSRQISFDYISPSAQYPDSSTYDIYEIYLPVMTTRAQEDAVDAKIKTLKATTFKGYENWSNEQKIKAAYSYVINNVSGFVGNSNSDAERRMPIYHTAYSALINGQGTCEAFALAFTRLTRELGVSSKVIMGVDSNNHTYNIADFGENKWYFVDCSARLYKKTSSEFSRAKEKEEFLTDKFKINYWNKVVGVPHTSAGIIDLIDADTEFTINSFSSLPDGCDYISTNGEDGHNYILKLNKDIKLTNVCADIEIKSGHGNVTLDLNKKVLTIDGTANFNFSELKNGTIKHGSGPYMMGDAFFENASSGKTILKDINFVKVGHTGLVCLSGNSFNGNAFILDNVSFKSMQVEINGIVKDTASENGMKLYVKNNVTFDSCDTLFGNYDWQSSPTVGLIKDNNTCGKLVFKGNNGVEAHGEKINLVALDNEMNLLKFTRADVLLSNTGSLKRISYGSDGTPRFKITGTDIVKVDDSFKPSSDYNLYQSKNGNVSLQITTFTLKYKDASGNDVTQNCVDWADLIDYINTNNKNIEYYIYLLDDINQQEAFELSMPKNAANIIINGNGHRLSHKGNIKLTKKVTLNNVIMNPVDAKPEILLNGNTLKIATDVDISVYDKVSGTGKSILDLYTEVNSSDEIVTGVTTLKNVDVATVNIGQLRNVKATGTFKVATITVEDATAEPVISRLDSTVMSINKIVLPEDEFKLHFQTIDSNGNLIGTSPNKVLFTTSTKIFDTSRLCLNQPDDYDKYCNLTQFGNNITVTGGFFEVYYFTPEPEDSNSTAIGVEGEIIGQYQKWSEAIAAINNLKNKNQAYEIKVNTDVVLQEKLAMPTKASELYVTSAGETKTISYLGDLTSGIDVTFKNVNLNAIDAKGDANNKAKVNVNRIEMTFLDVSFGNEFASIVGNGKGAFYVIGTTSTHSVKVTGNISVPILGLIKTRLYCDGTLNVGNKMTLISALVDVKKGITVKDLESCDANNIIRYGAGEKDVFKITGHISSSETGDYKAVIETSPSVENRYVNSCAIHVVNKYVESYGRQDNNTNPIYANYVSDKFINKNIIDAKMVPANYFVIGRGEINSATTPYQMHVKYLTKKVGNYIRVDNKPVAKDVELIELSADGFETSLGYYETLQETFDAIKLVGSKEYSYRIEINPNLDSDIVSNNNTNIVTPSNVRGITIQYAEGGIDDELTPIQVKNTITLNCDLELNGIYIADNINEKTKVNNTIKINLNHYSLSLIDTGVSGDRIGSITGASYTPTNKGTSALYVRNSGYSETRDQTDQPTITCYTLKVNGKLEKVAKVLVQNNIQSNDSNIVVQTLAVTGNTSIGILENASENAAFIGAAKVKYDKKTGAVQEVASLIDIKEEVIDRTPNSPFLIDLWSTNKNGDLDYVPDIVDEFGYTEDLFAPGTSKYQLLKTGGLNEQEFGISDNIAGMPLVLIRRNGSYYLSEEASFKYKYTLSNGSQELGEFFSLSDVTNEINRIKNKNASYVIKVSTVDEDADEVIEGFKLPNSDAAKQIQIVGEGSTIIQTNATTISFNTKTTIEGMKLNQINDKLVTMNINNVYVQLSSFEVLNGVKSVKGGGIGKGSCLKLGVLSEEARGLFTVEGDIKNVDKVILHKHDLNVTGQINIGTLVNENDGIAGSSNRLTGSAKLSFDRKKDEQGKNILKAVNSNITIVNSIENEDDCALVVDLQYVEAVNGDLAYKEVPKADTEMVSGVGSIVNSTKPSYAIINSSKADIKSGSGNSNKDIFTYGNEGNKKYIKSGGKIYWNTGMLSTTPGYTLAKWNGLSVATAEEIGIFASYSETVNEINTRKDANVHYIIIPNSETNQLKRAPEKIVMPLPNTAASLTISSSLNMADSDNEITVDYLNGTKLVLNSDVTIKNIRFRSSTGDTPISVNLGNYRLECCNTSFENDITNVSGKKLTGGSDLYLKNTKNRTDNDGRMQINVLGGISNVTSVHLNKVDLTADTINISNLYNENDGIIGSASVVSGGASVKYTDRSKAKIVSVTTKVNIANSIFNEDDKPLNIDLHDAVGSIIENDADASDAVNSLSPKYQVLKSVSTEATAKTFVYGTRNSTSSVSTANNIIKSKGVFYYNKGALTEVPGYKLYSWDGNDKASKIQLAEVISFADAVSEINSRKNKTVNYLIIPNAETDSIKRKTESYALPAVNTAESITVLSSTGEDDCILRYPKSGMSITTNVNTNIEGITFAPVEGNKGVTCSLTNKTLKLKDTKFSAGIVSVSGNGIAKGSKLVIKNTSLDGSNNYLDEITGNLINVETVSLEKADLTVKGKTQIGNLVQVNTSSTTEHVRFTGSANVKTVKKGNTYYLNSVGTNISVANRIVNAENGIIDIDLIYSVKENGIQVTKYVYRDNVTNNYIIDRSVKNSNFKVINAPKADLPACRFYNPDDDEYTYQLYRPYVGKRESLSLKFVAN